MVQEPQPPSIGVARCDFLEGLLRAEVFDKTPPGVPIDDRRRRLNVGTGCDVGIQKGPQRGPLPLRYQPNGCQLVGKLHIEVSHPSSRFAVQSAAGQQGRRKMFHAHLDRFGQPLRHLAQPNRPPLAIATDKLNCPPPVGIA
ncbi:MAG: hypothetical protein WCB27_01320 [Thermoguttaceae bacterium]